MHKFVWKRGFNSEREGGIGGGQEMGRNPQQKTQTQQCSLGLGRHELDSDDTLKNFALWSHKCPHVQSLCMCMNTCKHNLHGESVVQTPAKIFIQNCFMAHWQCVYVCMAGTHIHTCVLYKSLE